MRVPKWIPRKDEVGSFFVVRTTNDSPSPTNISKLVDLTLKDKFLLPNLKSFYDLNSPEQSFYTMTTKQRQGITHKCSNGLYEVHYEKLIKSTELPS